MSKNSNYEPLMRKAIIQDIKTLEEGHGDVALAYWNLRCVIRGLAMEQLKRKALQCAEAGTSLAGPSEEYKAIAADQHEKMKQLFASLLFEDPLLRDESEEV